MFSLVTKPANFLPVGLLPLPRHRHFDIEVMTLFLMHKRPITLALACESNFDSKMDAKKSRSSLIILHTPIVPD